MDVWNPFKIINKSKFVSKSYSAYDEELWEIIV